MAAHFENTYSVAEAGKFLKLTERRVRQLIDEGRLNASTDGMGRQRLSRADINLELARRGWPPLEPARESTTPAVPSTSALDEALDRIARLEGQLAHERERSAEKSELIEQLAAKLLSA